jgi:uncharacterized protein YdeI (YjbR/CyaY-like superfamily)
MKSNNQGWQKEMDELRALCVECGLREELKWGKPCFTFENKNIVLIQGFKEYCALLFFKGYLMKDPEGLLVKTGENTRVGRQLRVTNFLEIIENEASIKGCIREAIAVEKSGAKDIETIQTEIEVPQELQKMLDQIPALKGAFESLTPGRQRAYIFYFSQPKQSATRISRIEKNMKRILDGKGLNES